jgi:hypothetical protein
MDCKVDHIPKVSAASTFLLEFACPTKMRTGFSKAKVSAPAPLAMVDSLFEVNYERGDIGWGQEDST